MRRCCPCERWSNLLRARSAIPKGRSIPGQHGVVPQYSSGKGHGVEKSRADHIISRDAFLISHLEFRDTMLSFFLISQMLSPLPFSRPKRRMSWHTPEHCHRDSAPAVLIFLLRSGQSTAQFSPLRTVQSILIQNNVPAIPHGRFFMVTSSWVQKLHLLLSLEIDPLSFFFKSSISEISEIFSG